MKGRGPLWDPGVCPRRKERGTQREGQGDGDMGTQGHREEDRERQTGEGHRGRQTDSGARVVFPRSLKLAGDQSPDPGKVVRRDLSFPGTGSQASGFLRCSETLAWEPLESRRAMRVPCPEQEAWGSAPTDP